jgi:hypothetical protein
MPAYNCFFQAFVRNRRRPEKKPVTEVPEEASGKSANQGLLQSMVPRAEVPEDCLMIFLWKLCNEDKYFA